MTRKPLAAACAMMLLASPSAPFGQQNDPAQPPLAQKKPKVTLKARPEFGIAPVRVVLTAELEGGSDDFEEFYCPTVVWEWGDGATSESSTDCPPYEPGQSKIKRRYTVEHVYKRSSRIRVYFSLRHRDKEVSAVGVNITIQPGGKDNSQ